jgi:hypothetical protein
MRVLDRAQLLEPFLEKEVSEAIGVMKSNSAPGPNGFTVIFFKKLWLWIKDEIMKMVHVFNNNMLDLQRLNFGGDYSGS